MTHYLSAAEREYLFEEDQRATLHWVGSLHRMDDNTGDVIPFRFKEYCYLISFYEPIPFFGGDPDALVEMAQGQSDGYVPDANSRVIKFYRSDAEENEFKEKFWFLPSALDIYEFCNILTAVISSYAEAAQEIRQFFYLAASDKLARIYKRVFREASNRPGCMFSEFEPILEKTGEYDGYQRKTDRR